jgi:hypothetical protein
MDELWRQYSSYRQPRIDGFADDALGAWRNQNTLFYPFSGPDILFATAFFPTARNYVLVGLEGTEMLPNWNSLNEAERQAALEGIYTSITTALNCSFFITKDMRRDLQSTRLRGTLPIVLVFLARLGADIQSVEPVHLDRAGNLGSGIADGKCPGYRVNYRLGGFGGRSVYYFQENLGDENLSKDKRLLTFVNSLGRHGTYVKSASYLMHSGGFTNIRNYILQNSSTLLQDDSGIPLRNLVQAGWQTRYYGSYAGVLDIFKEYYQPDLAAAVQRQGVQNIDFGIGYMFEKGDSVLIHGTRP